MQSSQQQQDQLETEGRIAIQLHRFRRKHTDSVPELYSEDRSGPAKKPRRKGPKLAPERPPRRCIISISGKSHKDSRTVLPIQVCSSHLQSASMSRPVLGRSRQGLPGRKVDFLQRQIRRAVLGQKTVNGHVVARLGDVGAPFEAAEHSQASTFEQPVRELYHACRSGRMDISVRIDPPKFGHCAFHV